MDLLESPPPTMVPPAVPAGAPLYRAENPAAVVAAPVVQPAPLAGVPPGNYPPQSVIQFTQAGVMPPAENINFPYSKI